MKPTNQCKRNYLKKYYFNDPDIPSSANVTLFKNTYLNNFYINVEREDGTMTTSGSGYIDIEDHPDQDLILNLYFKNKKNMICANCINMYICKLGALKNETYTEM